MCVCVCVCVCVCGVCVCVCVCVCACVWNPCVPVYDCLLVVSFVRLPVCWFYFTGFEMIMFVRTYSQRWVHRFAIRAYVRHVPVYSGKPGFLFFSFFF